MATRPPIQIFHSPVRSYETIQRSFAGASPVSRARGWWPDAPVVAGGAARVDKLVEFGRVVAMAGDFTSIGTVSRTKFGAFNLDDGAVSAFWDQTFTGGAAVVSALGTDGTHLYVGGSFETVTWKERRTGVAGGVVTVTTSIAGHAVSGIVRFDKNGNLDLDWNPSPNADPGIKVIEWNPTNETVYIAGAALTTLRGVTTRAYIAEVMATDDGSVTAWNADPNGEVRVVRPIAEHAFVYLGGSFTTLKGGSPATRIARLTMTGAGTLNGWLPLPSGTRVNDLAISAGENVVYVAGDFLDVNGVALTRYVAALHCNPDATSIAVFSGWFPYPNAEAYSLAIYRDLVFITGAFTTMKTAPVTRNRLALVTGIAAFNNPGGAALQDWDPGENATVPTSLLVDRTLYVGGAITGGVDRHVWPIFTDANSKFVNGSTGSDDGAGTSADPYKTLKKGLDAAFLPGPTFSFVVIQDSSTYIESELSVNQTHPIGAGGQQWSGLYAADGQVPRIEALHGAIPGTYGARSTGRTKFFTGGTALKLFVSKTGVGSGVRGDPMRPFGSVGGAMADPSRLSGDCIEIQDSNVYFEAELDALAKDVTIQAAPGQTPTISAPNTTVLQLTGSAGTSIRVYGITFGARPGGDPSIDVNGGDMEVVDCSFTWGGGSTGGQVRWGGAGGATANGLIENCSFYRSNGQAVAIGIGATALSLTIRNCATRECQTRNNLAADQFPTLDRDADIDWSPSGAGMTATLLIASCTFENTLGNQYILLDELQSNAGSITVKDCLFSDSVRARVIRGIRNEFSQAAGTVLVHNCLFDHLGGEAIADLRTNVTSQARTYRSLVAQSCAFINLTTGASFKARGSHVGDVRFQSCASLSAGCNGIYVERTAGTGTVNIVNCCLVNSGRLAAGADGIAIVRSANLTTNIANCLEFGSANFSLDAAGALGTLNLTNSIFQKAVNTPFTGGEGFIGTDPMILSSVSGQENVGLQALSPCVLGGSDLGGGTQVMPRNIGLDEPLVEVASITSTAIDGITFGGDPNFFDGVRILRDSPAPVTVYGCTFDGLATQGVFSSSVSGVSGPPIIAERCLFECNGIGVTFASPDMAVVRSVMQRCGSAGVLVGSPATHVDHVTAALGAFGQVDRDSAGAATQTGNILASNIIDYRGEGIQFGSVVPVLSGGASVTGSRRDPLFRDSDSPDVRIQAIAAGQFFDSPAIGLAPDGEDAGAFIVHYGPENVEYSVLDFGINPTDTPTAYRGPMHYTRSVVPYKPSEGDTHGGNFYSNAAAFRKEHIFEWEPDSMMPAAQVADLIALFTTGTGEVLLSLDGGLTRIPCRIVRSSEFVYTEIAGSFYGSDTLPTPVSRLVLRESA